MNKTMFGALYVIGAAVLWSTGGLFVKQIAVDPLLITAMRSTVSGLFFLPFIKVKRLKFSLPLCGYILAYTWLVTGFVTATKLTAAANAIALQNTAPLFLFLFSIFGFMTKKEKPSFRSAVPVVFIALGVSFMLCEPVTGSSFLGNVIGLSTGVAFALMTIFLAQLSSISGKGLVGISNLIAAVIIFFFVPDISSLFTLDLTTWLRFLYLGVFQLGLPYVLYMKALQYISPLKASIFALTEALLNPVWVLIFVGEKPTFYGFIGFILILTAVGAEAKLKQEECEFQRKKTKGSGLKS